MSEFDVQGLANTACATVNRPVGSLCTIDFAMGILRVIWAYNFAEMLSMDFYWAFRKILVEIGRAID